MKATDRLKRTQTRLAEKLKRYRAARSTRKQRGVTLLEIIIVLGIIGTIAAGVVILAQRAFDNKAMSDLVSNVNAVRVAAKDAYGQTGIYPAGSAAAATSTVGLNETNLQTDGINAPIGRLILLGKLSTQEARNPISGNYMYFASANLGNSPGAANKGFVVQVNGLNRTQCRNLLTQVGNQWDYVEVAGMQAGNYVNATKDLTVATGGVTGRTGSDASGAVSMNAQGVYRSLNSGTPSGNFAITADAVIGACTDGSNNGIILGSR